MIITVVCLFIPVMLVAQHIDLQSELHDQQLEDLAENIEDENLQEDDYNFQQLLYYSRHPLNINAPEDELSSFPLFAPIHVQNILLYRNVFGNFISIYELQVVPGFTPGLLRTIAPYIVVAGKNLITTVSDRFRKGSQTAIVRPLLIAQKQTGFSADDAPNRFLGDRLALFARYKYHYHNLLLYGVTLEKDAGERYLKREAPFLMDYQSAHFFLRNVGQLKALALGDFTVNLGQGLIHWQSQAFKKTSGVLNIKRQSEVLRPYQSAGENAFFRGAGATVAAGRWEATVFASSRNLSANFADGDEGSVITSFDYSGFHRNEKEEIKRNNARQLSSGANLRWRKRMLQLGGNFIAHWYSLPIQKQEEPYNVYSIAGTRWINGSIDASVTIRNYHVFGEAAIDLKGRPAFLAGLISSLSRVVDLSILYRQIDAGYQSVYGNAFTENTFPTNETGVYSGLSLKAGRKWRLDLYADVFTFPWIKYRVDAPSGGYHHFLQLNWKPSKATECYTRFRVRSRPLNFKTDGFSLPQSNLYTNWRTHVSHQLSRELTLRCRMEKTTFMREADSFREQGFLYFIDMIFKPDRRWYSFNMRLQYFEADSYETRIYAYEQDLLFVSSSPAFFDRGFRSLVNFKAKIRIKLLGINTLTASVKIANTSYVSKSEIGSGLSSIHGKNKTDVRFQLFIGPSS